ncbi:3132_t:CDS:2, partial [Racocetra fulgida]
MPQNTNISSIQEQREANTARKRRSRAKETTENRKVRQQQDREAKQEYQQRNERNAAANRQQHTHNVLTASQVAAIWVDGNSPYDTIQSRDIILRSSMDQLVCILEFSECYDPLAYPLLFPHGEQGWAPCQVLYKNVTLESEEINNNVAPNKEEDSDQKMMLFQ